MSKESRIKMSNGHVGAGDVNKRSRKWTGRENQDTQLLDQLAPEAVAHWRRTSVS